MFWVVSGGREFVIKWFMHYGLQWLYTYRWSVGKGAMTLEFPFTLKQRIVEDIDITNVGRGLRLGVYVRFTLGVYVYVGRAGLSIHTKDIRRCVYVRRSNIIIR